jgi:hypothetical protein
MRENGWYTRGRMPDDDREKREREREHFKSKHQICHADHYLVVNESKKGDY